MGNIVDLPDELIGHIAAYLRDEDLFGYAVTCKRIYSSLHENSALWTGKCAVEWLNLENSIGHVLRILTAEGQKAADEGSLMSFFSRRKAIEHYFMKDLAEMAEIGFCRKHWDLFFKHSKQYELVPFLSKRDAKFPINSLNVEDKICNGILTSIRHKIVFYTIEKFKDSTEELFNYEETILLPLSAIDQCFFNVIEKRDSFYCDCHSLIEKKFPMLKSSKNIPVTFLVKALTEVIISTIKRRFNGRKNGTEYFVENLLLSRVYAGEFEPHPLLLSCMIQHFCLLFGVRLSLASGVLVIHHNSLPEETYLIIRKRQKYEYQIIRKQTFIRSLEVGNGRRDMVINHDLDRMISIKSGRSIVRDFFSNVVAHYPRTRERFTHFYSKLDSSSWCTDFPIAKQGIDMQEVQYFNTFWQFMNRLADTRYTLEKNTIYNKLLKTMSKQYPEDLDSGLKFISADEAQKCLWFSSLKQFLGHVYPTHFMRGPTVGKFICSASNQGISLVINHIRYSDREELVTLLNCEGTLSHAYAKEIEVFEEYEIKDVLLSTFFTMNKHTRLDFFFRQITLNEGKVKLKPLESVYETFPI